MKKIVQESLNGLLGESIIKFNQPTQGLGEKVPVFKLASTAYIIGAIQRVNHSHFTGGKLDLDKFYTFLKGIGSMYKYDRSFEEMKETVKNIAPFLGIIDQIKFSREDKSEVKMQKRAIEGDLPLEFFYDSEVPADSIIDTDIVVRSMHGNTEPGFYRFDKKLSQSERNILRIAYSYSYGDPTISIWGNFLGAVPATVGFIRKHGRSFQRSSPEEGFGERTE